MHYSAGDDVLRYIRLGDAVSRRVAVNRVIERGHPVYFSVIVIKKDKIQVTLGIIIISPSIWHKTNADFLLPFLGCLSR